MNKEKFKSKGKYIFAVVLVAVVGVILLRSGTEGKITFADGVLQAKGMYGTEITADEISSVELSDSMPKILRKTNGADMFNTRTGFFTVEGLGKTRLYLNTLQGPFIIITTEDEPIIISFKDAEQTRQLYNEIRAYMSE